MNTLMFGRVRQAIVSAVVLLVAAITGSDASAVGSILLAFSSQRCGHCQAMRPTLQELESNGIPIRHVDVNAEPDFAQRHGIRQTPTYVVWSAGRELTRLVGTQPTEKIQEALAINPAGPLFQTEANVDRDAILNPPQTRLAATASAAIPQSRGEAMPSVSLADAVERARAATVRLRVHDGRGFGVGTGTIIDRHGEEALVLTCGHLFRETKHQSRVDVDLFVGGQIKTVPGQVIDYDADDRDIGLVVIRPGFDIAPVAVANPTVAPQAGLAVFSFGCDHGADPSRRDTRITGVNKYNQHLGASNIEIAGAPVDGRSGGGLFDAAGRLIGVCNAADYKGDVGIYTGPGSVKWQLDRVQLSHLYQREPALPSDLPSTPTPSAARQPETLLASVGQPQANQFAGGQMTVIVQDPNSPNGQRVLTVERPTAELMGHDSPSRELGVFSRKNLSRPRNKGRSRSWPVGIRAVVINRRRFGRRQKPRDVARQKFDRRKTCRTLQVHTRRWQRICVWSDPRRNGRNSGLQNRCLGHRLSDPAFDGTVLLGRRPLQTAFAVLRPTSLL